MKLTEITAMIALAGLAAGCDAAANAAQSASQFAEKTAVRVEDSALAAAVKVNLSRDPAVKLDAIQVGVHAGVVSLYGTQPTLEARAKAEAAAWQAHGVVRVVNQIQVPGAALPPPVPPPAPAPTP